MHCGRNTCTPDTAFASNYKTSCVICTHCNATSILASHSAAFSSDLTEWFCFCFKALAVSRMENKNDFSMGIARAKCWACGLGAANRCQHGAIVDRVSSLIYTAVICTAQSATVQKKQSMLHISLRNALPPKTSEEVISLEASSHLNEMSFKHVFMFLVLVHSSPKSWTLAWILWCRRWGPT